MKLVIVLGKIWIVLACVLVLDVFFTKVVNASCAREVAEENFYHDCIAAMGYDGFTYDQSQHLCRCMLQELYVVNAADKDCHYPKEAIFQAYHMPGIDRKCD